jgi:hypothetical protein
MMNKRALECKGAETNVGKITGGKRKNSLFREIDERMVALNERKSGWKRALIDGVVESQGGGKNRSYKTRGVGLNVKAGARRGRRGGDEGAGY